MSVAIQVVYLEPVHDDFKTDVVFFMLLLSMYCVCLVNQTVFSMCTCAFRLVGSGNAGKAQYSPKIRLVHETSDVYNTCLSIVYYAFL